MVAADENKKAVPPRRYGISGAALTRERDYALKALPRAVARLPIVVMTIGLTPFRVAAFSVPVTKLPVRRLTDKSFLARIQFLSLSHSARIHRIFP